MRIYTIFDDFPEEAVRMLQNEGISVTVHPTGRPRPDSDGMKRIIEEYDGVIIGTSQKITEDMFARVIVPKIIGTASVGTDHIRIPEEKRSLITVFNTPKANAQSVAEYTIGCALSCCKRLYEAKKLYCIGSDNKQLTKKPEDLKGKTIGVIGAGNISRKIMEYARFFGMEIICWTLHPEHHKELDKIGVRFVTIENLMQTADIISVNLPNKVETTNFISDEKIRLIKEEAIFISVSRLQTIDCSALLDKAREHENFYVCLDIDVDKNISKQDIDRQNILITPHIAGGTVDTRKRMFFELTNKIMSFSRSREKKENN